MLGADGFLAETDQITTQLVVPLRSKHNHHIDGIWRLARQSQQIPAQPAGG